MPSPTTEPRIDLGSLNPVRPFILIDGQRYHFKVDMDLNLVDLSRLTTLEEEIAAIEVKRNAKRLTREQVAELAKRIREGVQLVTYDLPDAVLDQLNDIQRLAVLEAFQRATIRRVSRPNRQTRRHPSTSRRRSRGLGASSRAIAGRTGS